MTTNCITTSPTSPAPQPTRPTHLLTSTRSHRAPAPPLPATTSPAPPTAGRLTAAEPRASSPRVPATTSARLPAITLPRASTGAAAEAQASVTAAEGVVVAGAEEVDGPTVDGVGGTGGGGTAGLGGGGDEERLVRVGLSRVVEPGDLAALKAFAGMGVLEIWELLRGKAPGTERWSTRLAAAHPERDLERAAAAGARFVIPGDDEWPEQVEVLAEAGQLTRRAGVPFGLWVRGPAHLRKTLERSVAMVGARACSSYGEHVAAELAGGLADNGITVVSGGAFGIDAAAHRGVLAGSGVTVAVLASGVDTSYPKSNSAMFSRIVEDGLVVSELPPGCSPTKLRFLARNRLIAAGTLGTVVIEAAVRSGALNSAGWAEQCGRAVLAVPGPITSRMSAGSHLLVRERDAVLVTSVAEIIEAVSPFGTGLAPHPQAPKNPSDDLPHDVRRTLDAVPVVNPAPAARIATTAGLDLPTTQSCLETLAALVLVESTPTGWRLTPTTPP